MLTYIIFIIYNTLNLVHILLHFLMQVIYTLSIEQQISHGDIVNYCRSIFLISNLILSFFVFLQLHAYTIETFYGSIETTDQAVIDVIESEAMQRLKKINQYGISPFIHAEPEYTRYEHSLGVFFLLSKFGASREESIFGLIHDISHTVFSHVADYMYNSVCAEKSYQDTIMHWFTAHTDLHYVLDKHKLLDIVDVSVSRQFAMLKNDLPALCVDRLEYNLHGAWLEGWLSAQDIMQILDDLRYENDRFFFVTSESAAKLAYASVRLSVEKWCAVENIFVYQQAASLLLEALCKDIISEHDFHFSDDITVWNILQNCQDEDIKEALQILKTYTDHFYESDQQDYDICVKAKFRGVDPLVKTDDGTIKKLTELDPHFADFFQTQRVLCSTMKYLKITYYCNNRDIVY